MDHYRQPSAKDVANEPLPHLAAHGKIMPCGPQNIAVMGEYHKSNNSIVSFQTGQREAQCQVQAKSPLSLFYLFCLNKSNIAPHDLVERL